MLRFVYDHIHLKSANIESTVLWYCNILGAKVIFEGVFAGSKVYYIDIGGATFIIFGKFEHESKVDIAVEHHYGIDHFGFAVDDIEKAMTELKAKGVKILEGPLDVRPGLRIAYIEGPDKVRIELSERN